MTMTLVLLSWFFLYLSISLKHRYISDKLVGGIPLLISLILLFAAALWRIFFDG